MQQLYLWWIGVLLFTNKWTGVQVYDPAARFTDDHKIILRQSFRSQDNLTTFG